MRLLALISKVYFKAERAREDRFVRKELKKMSADQMQELAQTVLSQIPINPIAKYMVMQLPVETHMQAAARLVNEPRVAPRLQVLGEMGSRDFQMRIHDELRTRKAKAYFDKKVAKYDAKHGTNCAETLANIGKKI